MSSPLDAARQLQLVTVSPQRMLAALRWLIVIAAFVLAFHYDPRSSAVQRTVLTLGALFLWESLLVWTTWQELSQRAVQAIWGVNLSAIALAMLFLGSDANTLFLLFPIQIVEAALLVAPRRMPLLTTGVSGGFALAAMLSSVFLTGPWQLHDWLVLVLQILLLYLVSAISVLMVSQWRSEQAHIVQLALLDEMTLLLSDTRRLDDVLAKWVELVPRALHVQACAIALTAPGQDRRIWVNLGADADAILDEALLTPTAIRRLGQLGIVRQPVGQSPYAAIYTLPLPVDDRTVGVFSVARSTPDPFDSRDQRVFQSLASHAAQSMRNARLYQLEAEKAQQSHELERFKSEMLASVSHEFRLPLASISLATETLLGTMPDADAQSIEMRLLRNIQRSTHRLNGFVQDVLDLARLDANTLELRYQQCDLVEIARTVADHVREQCDAKQQRLIFETQVEHGILFGDAKRLEQVVSNLLTNAHQYTPEGGEITLTLALAGPSQLSGPCGDDAGASVVLSVRDTGPGIPVEEREHIFERFQRGQAGRQRSAGAGLGLYIAHSVVTLHGGCLWVAGNSAGGSTFWCLLPLAEDVSVPVMPGRDEHLERRGSL